MIRRFSHAGLVVRDIKATIELYTELFGLQPWSHGVLEIPEVGAKIFTFVIGDNLLELMEPTDNEMPMGKFLRERGEGLYHINLRVGDLDAAVRSLRGKGAIVEDPIQVLSVPWKSKIAWVSPQSVNGAIIELVERPRSGGPNP